MSKLLIIDDSPRLFTEEFYKSLIPKASKPRHRSIKSLCAEADRLWSQAVTKRDGDRCKWGWSPYCKKVGHHSHHTIKRRNKQVRHKIENGTRLCYECHDIAESRPKRFKLWAKNKMGQVNHDKLIMLSNKVDKPDYEARIGELKDFLNNN